MSENTATVVIIEDNELNLKLFHDILEAHQCDVEHTRDAREAIELITDTMPDLVIMDIQLPFISGEDLIVQMKDNAVIKHIPVIAVTAFALEQDRARIMQTGCEDYMAKPVAIPAFITTLKKYLPNISQAQFS